MTIAGRHRLWPIGTRQPVGVEVAVARHPGYPLARGAPIFWSTKRTWLRRDKIDASDPRRFFSALLGFLSRQTE